MERTSKEEVNIPSIKEIRLERRRLARQNRKRRIFFNTTIDQCSFRHMGLPPFSIPIYLF